MQGSSGPFGYYSDRISQRRRVGALNSRRFRKGTTSGLVIGGQRNFECTARSRSRIYRRKRRRSRRKTTKGETQKTLKLSPDEIVEAQDRSDAVDQSLTQRRQRQLASSALGVRKSSRTVALAQPQSLARLKQRRNNPDNGLNDLGHHARRGACCFDALDCAAWRSLLGWRLSAFPSD